MQICSVALMLQILSLVDKVIRKKVISGLASVKRSQRFRSYHAMKL